MRTILCIFFLPACLLGGVFEDQVVPILERSCLKCHGGEKTKGKVDFSGILTELDAGDHLDLWETVVEVVELGEMPPEDENPLSPDEKKGIRGWHEEFLKLPVETAIPVFRPRRLSANEYRNTLRSLFGFDLEVGIARAEQTESGDKSLILKILPPDPPGKSGFFNDTHSTPLSSSLLENYTYLAGISLDRLFSIQGKDSLARMTGQNEDWNGEITPDLAKKLFAPFYPGFFDAQLRRKGSSWFSNSLKARREKPLLRGSNSSSRRP